MVKLIPVFILLHIPLCLKAQRNYKNSIQVDAGSFCIDGRKKLSYPAEQLGLSFQRLTGGKFSAELGYSKWYNWRKGGANENMYVGESPIVLREGALYGRQDYNFLDATFYYLFNIGKAHLIKGGIGLSHSWGLNRYIDTYWINEEEPRDAVIYTSYMKERYWGIVPKIGYDYFFLRDRFKIGIDLTARLYNNIRPAQYNYSIHFGVNF